MIKAYKEIQERPQALSEGSTQPPEDQWREGYRRYWPLLAGNTTRVGTWLSPFLEVRSQQGYSLAGVSYVFASLAQGVQEQQSHN